MAQGEPTSSGPAVRVLFGPFRLILPMGWMGGRYTTSNPIAATRGSSAAAVAKVPCRGVPSSFQPPVERGKNSYQEPNSARSRSTTAVYAFPRVTSSRRGLARRISVMSAAKAGAIRSASGRSERSAAATASRAGRLGRGAVLAAFSNSRAPISMSFARSSGPCPAATFASTACRHVVTGSLQASTR